MIDRKKLDMMEENGGAAALKYRDELGAELQATVNDTLQAVNAYFDNVKIKKRAISERVDSLREECSRLESCISDYGPKLAAATISGDSAALETIQRELSELEANKAATEAQIELLSKVQITGDADLYNKANKLSEKLTEVNRETMANFSALAAFADKQIDLWRQVSNFSAILGNTVPLRSVLSRVHDMQQDYEGQ